MSADVEPGFGPSQNALVEVQSVLEKRLAGKPGILGIGIGAGSRGAAQALRVYVKDKKTSQSLPKEIEGIEIVGDVVGAIKAW